MISAKDSELIMAIPFDEIVSGAVVRAISINDVQYLSIRDIIMCVCGKNADYAGYIWRNIPESKKDKLEPFLSVYQFPGQGQSEQSVITLSDSIKLVMMLPGNRAQRYKVKFAEIVSRYIEGDLVMCDEIKENLSIGKKRSYSKFAQDIECRVHEDAMEETPKFQFIYATKSAAFPGLIKIGRTSDMRARLSQLNTGCAPNPHTVVTIAPTLDMYRDECLAHQHFSEERQQGEFFSISEDEVKEYFLDVITTRYQKELIESVAN